MTAHDPMGELVTLLSRLPGVGERTAMRLAFFVLNAEREFAQSLGRKLTEIHDQIQHCESCGNFTTERQCRICTDPRREPKLVCAVAHVQDLMAIERAGSFRGKYYVLHKLLAPLDGVGPDQLPIRALMRRVEQEGIEEVVVATPLSVEGEATALYLAEALRPRGVRVSRIASGIPHGGELEFADQVTLGRALEGRRNI